MFALRRRREDYAPSRVAYRVTRLWLSPMVRVTLLWLLPLGMGVAAAAWWVQQPQTQDRIERWSTHIQAQLRSQEDFRINHLAITGASPDLAAEIRRVVDIEFPISVLDLDLAAVRAKVAAFDAVAAVETRALLGGALLLDITERVPAVIWRHGGGLDLLDTHGHRVAITDRRLGAPDLPLITGRGADRAVQEALTLFAAAAPIEHRLRGLTRQGERRWDMVLTGGTVIQLPETGTVAALERVIALHEAGELLDRDISHIDMRNPARPTIRLGAQAFGYLRTLRAFEQGLKQQ